MDKIDQLQDDISELENFLKGSEKSLEIIAEEVKTEISLHQKEIDFCNERITNLLNTLEPNTQNLFSQTNKKHQFNNPLCFIEQFKCSYCHWPIERNLASSVEKGTIIELCPQCERILTPQAAKV